MEGYPNLRFNCKMNEYPCIDIVAAMSVPDNRLNNVTSVHSGSTDYATLVRPLYLIVSLLYVI